MKNTEERVLLKEILSDVFLPLYDEIEIKYAALEQRVRDELPMVYDAYTVYSTVLQRARLDIKHEYLSAMIPSEAEEPVLDARKLTEDLRDGSQPAIETVFCESDYLKCLQLMRGEQKFGGAFVVKSERFPIKCRLLPVDRYRSKAEALHNAFQRNEVPWTTVNGAYLNKFFDVCLTEIAQTIPPGMKIRPSQIEIDFGSYKETIKRGFIPVWNVDMYRHKGEDFPMPVIDSVNYEYRFDTGALGEECGFLVNYDNAYILYTRREGGALVVVSNKQKELVWDMYRFRRRHDTPVDTYPYPILSNARKDSFSTRLLNKYGAHIATKAEMRKLLDSFEASEHVELTGFHFAGEQLYGDTYDMNPFIRDEVRDPGFQRTLALSFKAKNKDSFLNRDVASFLVSEFQSAFPEYRCVGILT
jgi:hypothetical protein